MHRGQGTERGVEGAPPGEPAFEPITLFFSKGQGEMEAFSVVGDALISSPAPAHGTPRLFIAAISRELADIYAGVRRIRTTEVSPKSAALSPENRLV